MLGLIWLKEGEHYTKKEKIIKGGIGDGSKLIRLETKQLYVQNVISAEENLRASQGDEDAKRMIKLYELEMLRELQDHFHKMILKDMVKNNPILYEILIKATSESSFPFYPLKSRQAKVGLSQHIPKGTMLLMLHPEDFQVLEDHNAE